MTSPAALARRAIKVRGLVQGVGFRPFAYGLASGLDLRGFIRNENDGVLIEVEGAPESLDRFVAGLTACPPPRARVRSVAAEPRAPRGDRELRISPSVASGEAGVFVSPDIATCEDCLAELRDPADRRHGYPFLSCSSCGPRLTIVDDVPYDRARTAMAAFPLCARCRAEYEDPADRRYHAQATACADCGPRARLLDFDGREVAGPGAAVPAAAAAMDACGIVAVKGLGGWHLACDAGSQAAVLLLRRRKRRDDKAFAVMVADLAAARALCEVSPREEQALGSPRRPIVLLRRRAGAAVAEAVAPGEASLGLMLPYTPLHDELLRARGGRPMVLTSGNLSDEPIAADDAEAQARLRGVADLLLTNDRPVRARCDDSVVRVVEGRELPLRRARGYAPAPVELPLACPEPILALGGQLKAAFALGHGRRAYLSQHLGDLDELRAYEAFTQTVARYERLFRVTPRLLAHDLHPDYATTRLALERAAGEGLELRAVQHHHAHMASVMADNGLNERVIGVCFDGSGYGTDGTLWGGEFLIGDYAGFERAAHLRPVRMPGGEAAAREPWRMAVSHLSDAGESLEPLLGRIPADRLARLAAVRTAPMTSSCGRLFDAVASLLAARDVVSHEGQAAAQVERLALDQKAEGGYPFDLEGAAIDTRPLIAAMARELGSGADRARVARRFHTTIVEIIVDVCGRLRQSSGVDAVALSGGVFANSILAAEAPRRLRESGFRVFTHGQVPPNDGGLCLGQLAVAAAQGGRR